MSRTTDPTLTEHHLQRIEHALQQARNALLMGVTQRPGIPRRTDRDQRGTAPAGDPRPPPAAGTGSRINTTATEREYTC